jgi:transglutaminase-like putative cysteine protease
LVLQQLHTLLGFRAGHSVLALMLALKLLECRRERDFYVAVVLGLFFIVATFLVNQSWHLAVYALALVLGLVAVLERHNRGSRCPWAPGMRFGARALLQAAPLAAVLFLLSPRLEVPLWNLPLDRTVGITGLSDSMQPGSISRLVASDETAFRADFDGPVPAPAQRYWRGPVFRHFDGRRWSPGRGRQGAPAIRTLVEPLAYRVLLEPHGKRWVLALDLPVSAPPGTRLTADAQLLSAEPLRQRRRYQLRSVLAYATGPLSDSERAAALQLPGNVTSRMATLAASWRGASGEAAGAVRRGLEFLRREAFVYTLSPPRLGANPTDAFLFETRAGFCEHYASAFTLMMRLAGVPSRVVTGYLGGEYNAVGGHLVVRQSDAHAWSEVWLDGGGWTRVDPTAAVAPERVLRRIDPGVETAGAPVRFVGAEGHLLTRLAEGVRLTLDALNTRWDLWVLGYDSRLQGQILGWLGLGRLAREGLWLVTAAGAGLVVSLLGLVLLRGRPRPTEPLTRLYRLFCHRLAAVGLARAGHEGPRDFALRAATLRPDLAPSIERISALYCRLRFSGRGCREDLLELRREVRGFRPGRRARGSGRGSG